MKAPGVREPHLRLPMKYFEDAVVGEVLEFPETYRLTEENIVGFAREWDPQVFHVDKAAAERSFFGGLVACTAHLFAVSGKLSHSLPSPWAVVSALGITELKNHAPGRPGDVLSLRSCCVAKRESRSKPDMGITEFRNELVNQRSEVVLSYCSATLFHRRPERA